MDEDQKLIVIKKLQRLYILLPLLLWGVLYPVVVMITGEIDFRNWNVFARIGYGIYMMLAIVVSWTSLTKTLEETRKTKPTK